MHGGIKCVETVTRISEFYDDSSSGAGGRAVQGKKIRGRSRTWCSSSKRENFNRVSISHYRENFTAILNKEITRTPTLECTLECYEN